MDIAEQSPHVGRIRKNKIHNVENEEQVRRMTLERKVSIIG